MYFDGIRRWVGHSTKLGADQIAHASNWAGVPDRDMSMASVHQIRLVPRNQSTTTYVNALDPASDDQLWRDPAGTFGEVNAD